MSKDFTAAHLVREPRRDARSNGDGCARPCVPVDTLDPCTPLTAAAAATNHGGRVGDRDSHVGRSRVRSPAATGHPVSPPEPIPPPRPRGSAGSPRAGRYPVDLVRALKMSSAAEGNVGVGTLVRNFHAAHGMKGFVTQGVGPEMLRATYMRVSKFFLFPIMHRAMYDKEPSQGSMGTKMAAAIVCSLPEGASIAPIETAKIAIQLDTKNAYKNSMNSG